MIKVTESMIERAASELLSGDPEGTDDIRNALEAVLNSAEVRVAFEAELRADVTEEPQEIGAKVIDADCDMWVRGREGWGIRHNHGRTSWRSVLTCGPLRRVR